MEIVRTVFGLDHIFSFTERAGKVNAFGWANSWSQESSRCYAKCSTENRMSYSTRLLQNGLLSDNRRIVSDKQYELDSSTPTTSH